jgi:phospholipase C
MVSSYEQANSGSALSTIKRIVVVMMENRSFDHMIGYLGLAGGIDDLNGLQNAHPNWDVGKNEHPPYALGPGATAFYRDGDKFDTRLDPCHSKECVREQLAEHEGVKPGGFVKNFIAQKSPPPDWRSLPMGYYTAESLPVYDFLARQFCVCDAWHSSVPGDTWPNRLFSLAGREGDKVPLTLVERVAGWFKVKLPPIPIYNVPAFTRQLDDKQWRWYSDDPATLRGADKLYRRLDDLRRENFAFFDRKQLKLLPKLTEDVVNAKPSFLDDAVTDQLPDVCWIDPNFVDLHVLNTISNDDHPPADIRRGQELVLDLYDALTKTRDWNDTLLVICYDEHGGFYDHVDPPAVPSGDESGYPTYGVRIPAILVGPRVERRVCHELFDHTSLIKTILLRFAADPRRALEHMPPRVRSARDLSVILADRPRQDLASHDHLRTIIDQWHLDLRGERRAPGASQPSNAPDGAGHPLLLTDYQTEFVRFAQAFNDIDHRSRPLRGSRGQRKPTSPESQEPVPV